MRDAARRERQSRDPNFIANTEKQIMTRRLPTGSRSPGHTTNESRNLLGATAARSRPYCAASASERIASLFLPKCPRLCETADT
jgi:hypothetical protein